MINKKKSIRARLGITIAVIVALVSLGVACTKTSRQERKPMPLVLPSNFPAPIYNLSSNPITVEGFELGRKLFYDTKLSRDGTISCGSCHIQGSAFTLHGHDVSHGIEDRLGVRNSPPIMNLAWSQFFFWDGGVFNLDLQPIAPIENPVEMDEHIPNVIEKLKSDAQYPGLFYKAFGEGDITSSKMLMALSQFMLQCVSAESKYDKVVRKEGAVFSAEEQLGFDVFKAKCASCHSSDLFTDNKFHNNGLVPSMVNDSGRYRITLDPKDFYLFKTPSLRNIMKTAPYMHDGRFLNIDAVLDHYDHGVQVNSTLDTSLNKNGVVGIKLTVADRANLKAFLNTLTDDSFIRNPQFAEQ